MIAPGDDFETKGYKYVVDSSKPSYLRLERASHIYDDEIGKNFEGYWDKNKEEMMFKMTHAGGV